MTTTGRLFIAILLIPVFIFFVGAQNRRPMTPEDVVSLNRASDAQISPDGHRVAFVVSAWDKENDKFNSDIWLAFDNRQSPVRLTSHAKSDTHPRWAPDAERLAFLSERDGDTESGAQIYLLNTRGGEPVRLTSHKSPVTDFEWSPDGRYIGFIAAEPVEKQKTRPPVVMGEDYRYAQLWLVEPASGKISQLTKGRLHVTSFNWSAGGNRIVYTARATPKLIDSNTTEVYVLPVDFKPAVHDTTRARPLTSGNGVESVPRFSPDGRWISYLAHSDGDPDVGPLRIHIIPSDGGGPGVLNGNFDGYIRDYDWVYDGRRIVFLAGVGARSRIYSVGLTDEIPQAMTRDEGVSSSMSMTRDGMNIAYIHENSRMPNEVALLSARNMIPLLLTRLNPNLEQVALGRVETVRWKSPDGTEIEGLVVYPLGYQTNNSYPMVTYIHGGPEGAYTLGFNTGWSAFPQIYAGLGYVVFMPNFRGSSNYGAAFAQSNARLVGKVDYEDIISGIDQLIKQGIADERRLAVAGWSYGGYMSAWMISHTDRFKCAVYGAGLSNAVSYWGTADIVAQRERLHGGAPWEAGEMYAQQSPLNHLEKVRTPTLIFHGEKDERVPLGQSIETYRKLKRLGVTAGLVIYPNEGHGLTIPSYQLDKIRRELEWIARFVPTSTAKRN